MLVRGTFPVNVSLEEVAERSWQVREALREFPEFVVVVPAIGRPDDGTDPTGYYNMETNVPLRPEKEWPAIPIRLEPTSNARTLPTGNSDFPPRAFTPRL